MRCRPVHSKVWHRDNRADSARKPDKHAKKKFDPAVHTRVGGGSYYLDAQCTTEHTKTNEPKP